MKICPKCKRIYNGFNDFYCLNDNCRLVNYSDEESEKDQLEKRNYQIIQNNNIPKCPTCQSTNIKRISGMKKVMHGVAFGLFSNVAHSQFECKNCGYKW